MAFGPANSHAFVDGNKKTALFLLNEPLYRNGYILDTFDLDIGYVILSIARKEMIEGEFIKWTIENAREISSFFENLDADE